MCSLALAGTGVIGVVVGGAVGFVAGALIASGPQTGGVPR